MIKKNTNSSNDCLYDCKELVCKHISSSSLNINCDDIVSEIRKPIDIDKFKEWFDRNINTFNSKQNKQTYFKKAFVSEMVRGKFDVVEVSVNYVSLVKALRDKGIKVEGDDTILLTELWKDIFKQGVTEEDAMNINSKIVAYMKSGQTFADYIELIKKSKTIQAFGIKIDWNSLNQRVAQISNDWDNAMNFFSMEVGLDDRETKELH